MNIKQGFGNPFLSNMPHLEYVLNGVKCKEAQGGTQPKPRLPITIEILQKLREVWLSSTHPDSIMLWAAACTGFFGFLRAGEFTVPSSSAYDPEVNLNLSDIAVDNHESPSMICILIKQSKTDPFRQGVEMFLGTTGSVVCPVQAILQYLAVRSAQQGPLFIFRDGSPLTRVALVSFLTDCSPSSGDRS